MYLTLTKLGRQKDKAEPLVTKPRAFDVEMAIEKLNDTNHEVLIKSQQNWLKQGVEIICLKSVHLFILFGIKLNSLRSGMSR